ncbi:MAG: substrate-binding domain-containing protein, partial [Thermomicrobiales bacterium]
MLPVSAGNSHRARRHGAVLLALIAGLTIVLTACGGAATATPPTGAASAPTKVATTTASSSAAATTSSSASSASAKATSAATAAASSTTASTTRASSSTSPAAIGSPAVATPSNNIKIAGPYQGEANSLNGAGSTFVQVLFSKWFDDYAKLTNVKVNYQGVGSGAGKKAITDQTVDFAASDAFMTDAELQAAQAKCGATIL